MFTHRREEKHIECFVGKPKRKRAIGKPRHKWKNNIMVPKGIGW
jgi:hypothetical protein